jgi:hypothetical protein
MFWCFFSLFVLMTVKIKHRKVLIKVIKFIVKLPFKILGFIGKVIYNISLKPKVEARKVQLKMDKKIEMQRKQLEMKLAVMRANQQVTNKV